MGAMEAPFVAEGNNVRGIVAMGLTVKPWLEYLTEIFERAHEAGIKLIVYPLGNPSGFDRGTRYNIDNDKGDVV